MANNYLNKKESSLIEYAAFYGSIKIFKYLQMNNAEINSSLWYYVIHGNNAELFEFLEEKNICPCENDDDEDTDDLVKSNGYIDCLREAIKCHHNNIAFYIRNNFIIKLSFNLFKHDLKYFNYHYLVNDIDNLTNIFNLPSYANYNYPYIVYTLLNDQELAKLLQVRIIFYLFLNLV